MNDERREHLHAWYRQALARRAAALEALVPGIVEGSSDAEGEAREIAWALAGSGATYGFPDVTEAGRIATAAGGGLLPRVLGLVDVLRAVAGSGATARNRAGRWILYAAAPLPDPPDGGAVPAELGLGPAWERLSARLGVDATGLARRIADRLGVAVADPDAADPPARLVVPPGLALERRVLPLREDGARIVAASANPTDVLAMAALERATGRSAHLDVLDPPRLDAALRTVYAGVGTDGPPDHGAPPPAPDRGATPADAPEPLSVLVVDDDAGDRLLCRTALEGRGFAVLHAASGAEALNVLDGDARVDLVLVDVLMPGMDGRELLRAIRAHPRRVRLPVVVLTGLQSPEAEARLMEEGADDYLRKPLDPRVLRARIRACLRRCGVAVT